MSSSQCLRTLPSASMKLLSQPVPLGRLAIAARSYSSTTTTTPEASQSIPPPSTDTKSSTSSIGQRPQRVKGPYFVARTPSNNLPVYEDKKRGGNLKLTLLRKIEGDAQALKDELVQALQSQDVSVNPVTNHITIKGHHGAALKQYLANKGF